MAKRREIVKKVKQINVYVTMLETYERFSVEWMELNKVIHDMLEELYVPTITWLRDRNVLRYDIIFSEEKHRYSVVFL